MDLKKLYIDPKFSAAFAGKTTFNRAARKKDARVKHKDVEKALQASDSYTLHKPVKREPLYRRIYSKGIGDIYQADLVDMTKFAKDNSNYKFIITIIDIFSKKAWAMKLKKKTGDAIVNVMKPFFLRNKCKKIEFDQGTEFYNKKIPKSFKTT